MVKPSRFSTWISVVEASTRSSNEGNAGRSSSTVVIIALSVTCVVTIAALLVALLYYLHMRHKLNRTAKKNKKKLKQQSVTRSDLLTEESFPKPLTTTEPDSASLVQVFAYKQLEAATNGFCRENNIGHGGVGTLYKGVLQDGTMAAMKQLEQCSRQGDLEFRMEVEMLKKLHSPYLLGLRGYCSEGENRVLVYDCMPNGSLQDYLYSKGDSDSFPYLDWKTRMCVALDVARALEYLHECVNPPVIHRDLKSSNILLDANFNAKVSDFGLAKLASDKVCGLVSTRVLGTYGYVAPDYAMSGRLTTKSDVYSYGVVLLELLTGRVPIDMKRPPGEGVLVSWALPQLTDRQKLAAMVDPVLEGQYAMKDLIQVAAIAAMCVQPEPDYRPLMTDVVQSLIPLVKHRS